MNLFMVYWWWCQSLRLNKHRMVGLLVDDKLDTMWKEAFTASLRNYSGISTEGLRNATKQSIRPYPPWGLCISIMWWFLNVKIFRKIWRCLWSKVNTWLQIWEKLGWIRLQFLSAKVWLNIRRIKLHLLGM
jgi:hypothetical protein